MMFWLLAAFLALLALTGGSSRSNVLSLVVLQPAAILLAAAALWTVTGADLRRCRFALILWAACFALTLLHLVPLPPSLWQALPGRGLVATIDRAAGLGEVWRPLSLDPAETRRSLAALSVPLAVLLAGAQLDRGMLGRLLPVVLGIALFGALLALVQLAVPAAGLVFAYGQRVDGAAGGVFANRNHQAMFLATIFPMLATLLTIHARGIYRGALILGAVALAVLIVPLLLVTGSRAGIALAALALPLSWSLLRLPAAPRRPRPPSRLHRLASRRALAVAAVLSVLLLVGLTAWASRALSLTRMLDMGGQAELRFKVWPVILAEIPTYFPVGAGIGSFVAVFQVAEPDAILRPTYLNRAHSEVLEIALTAGLPGLALLAVAVAGWAVGAWRAFASPLDAAGNPLGRLGAAMIALLALGSFADYPLRTPLLAAVLAVAALWASRLDGASASWARNEARGEGPVRRTEGSIG